MWTDKDAPRIIRLFERFVGRTELAKKLEQVQRALKASGSIYRKFWVRSANWLWLGIQEAQRLRVSRLGFQNRVTPEIHRALQFAEMLRLLYHDMPQWKRDEVRRRLLAEEVLTPLEIELMTALHYQMTGCKVVWMEPRHHTRSFDLLVRCGTFEFEIECKAKTIDAGRRISRRQFYRLCDSIEGPILNKKLVGVLTITLPGRLPSNTTDLLDAVSRAMEVGSASLEDGAEVVAKLVADSGEPADLRVELEKAEALRGLFGHVAFAFPDENSGHPCKPLVIVCRSRRDDDLMTAVESNLVDALKQLSGTRPANIVCYIPELGSFEGLHAPNTAISLMTSRFFQRESATQVFAVDYVTDAQVSPEIYGFRSEVRSLRFKNPRFKILG